MNGARAVLCALLICVATLGGVVIAADSPDGASAAEPTVSATDAPLPQTDGESDRLLSIVSEGDTAEYLDPPPGTIDRSGQETVIVDVSSAVGTNSDTIRSEFRQESLVAAFEEATTDAERNDIAADAATRLDERADALIAAERTAIAEYNDGAIGEREFLSRIAAIDRAADRTATTADWLRDDAETHLSDEAQQQVATDAAQLLRLQGPVRERTAAALGGDEPVRVNVDTREEAVVLATVDDGTYVREAVDPTAQTVHIEDRYDDDTVLALSRFQELYPWVDDARSGTSISLFNSDHPPTRIYQFEIPHTQGELMAYLDGGSADIIHETHRLDPESMPATTYEASDNGLALQVNATRGGGPLGIEVVDADTGDDVPATVRVNESEIGTADDGQLWTVSPRGAVTVTASHGGDSVSLETEL
ncbi:uncharacterized protein NP_5030A [Natronomonas pharaonis DSM 2160]|uniref:Uncharacterized protein n=1 Tax=Natronomonas pharaonis (strain ATCC 35678 / DSM 2160 / CIP 103997 / JCM 8858 / NBRC 14720 / NCIMB 2260 / Gabara) TaxID=348780 RepID=A0A1U7EZ73_NATPD|nr:hypothetical protein [Natronomonas pharaonis]CAI50606.1 uncharacterized protein NP_5030A [Natronomonas pharaonis DSM 2160]